MIIQHNIMALNSHRQLAGNNSLVSKNLEKLSSGYKINRAGDDAAGLAISEKMRAQITGLTRAQSNAQDGISLVQTAEGALTEVHSMLNRMVDLATQSANGTIKEDDRQKVQDEVDALLAEIDRISDATDFNGIKLLDGSLGGGTKTVTPGELGESTITTLTAQEDTVEILAGKGVVGDIKVAVASVSAAKAKGSATVGTTQIAVAGPSNASLNGKTVTIQRVGAASQAGLAEDADGNAVISIVASNGATAATVKSAIDAAITALSGGHKWKSLDFTGTTLTGAEMKNFEDAGDAMKATLAGGREAGKKVTVKDGEGTVGEAIVATADWVNGVEINAVDTSSGKNVKMNIKDVAKAVTDYAADTKVADATKAPDTAATTSFKFDDNLKVGATLTVGSGSTAKVFELVASGTATKNSGATAVVLGSNAGATIDALVAAVNAEATLGVTAAKSPDGTTITLTNSGTDVSKAVSASIGGMGLTMQIGDTADDYNKVSVSVDNMGVDGLGIQGLKAKKQEEAAAAIQTIKTAIGMVSSNRSRLGALQNRLEHTINNLGVTTENMTSAESRIRDVDMAKEMMAFTKNNVLSQAAQAMLAQANQQPQQVLQLLR